MSDDNSKKNSADQGAPEIDEAKRKELVEKIKASLLLEENETVQLYAALSKTLLP